MSLVTQISSEEFEKLTTPTLRLFLSVDLENSTRLKQTVNELNDRWLNNILLFVEAFPQLFENFLQKDFRILSEDEKNLPGAAVKMPRIWKMLGDELIFVSEINFRREVLLLIESFLSALQEWNADLLKGMHTRGVLRVKGAAWLAGFPVTNASFDIGNGQQDFAGPSLDAGFRIAKLATPRKCALSVDLAWMLCHCGIKAPNTVHYDGTAYLKGLAEDTGYPSLWLEVGESNFTRISGELLGREKQTNVNVMEHLCKAFISEFSSPRFPPFFPGEPEITPVPDSYSESLSRTRENLLKIYTIDSDSFVSSETAKMKMKQILERISQTEQEHMESLTHSSPSSLPVPDQ